MRSMRLAWFRYFVEREYFIQFPERASFGKIGFSI